MEVPASPFQEQQQQRRSSIGPERLQALLGTISSDGPPVPQSGFSAALITPRSESTLSRSALCMLMSHIGMIDGVLIAELHVIMSKLASSSFALQLSRRILALWRL